MTDRIYAKDIRAAGMCLVPGAKTFFEKNGLDWKDFIRNGIESDKLASTGDEMAMQVVRMANGK